jgi:uncharacterized Rossmann fold enzyme
MLEKKEKYPLNKVLDSIRSIFQHISHLFVFGGGSDIGSFMKWVSEFVEPPYFEINTSLIVAIDGATELLANYQLIPDLIITDLDGIRFSTMERKEYKSTFFVVHAHGDNQQKLDEFSSVIKTNPTVGTTQTDSKIPVINTGGFTDGDRALYFMENFLLPVHTMYLIGYDFSPTVGQFSKPYLTEDTPASLLKKRKLDIGAELTCNFCKRTKSKVIFLENLHSFTLKDQLKDNPNIQFTKFHSKQDLEKILPSNLLYLKQKS